MRCGVSAAAARWRTGSDSSGACVGSTAIRARRTTLSYCIDFIAVRVFWITVEVRRASARAGVRLGVSTGAALWRTVRDSRLAGGGSSTAVRARGSDLRSSPGTIRVEQSSAAGGVLAGTCFRHRDGAIGSVGSRGDDVAGCGLACSLGGRCRRLGRGDSPAASRGVTKRSRARSDSAGMSSESAAGTGAHSAVVTSSYFATKCRSSVRGLAGGAVRARGRARGGVLAGGAVGRGLRGSSCTIRVKQSSAAGGFLTGSRCRDGDGAIGSAIGRGDDVAGCGLACSLGGRCRRLGRGDSPAASRGVTKRSRARKR